MNIITNISAFVSKKITSWKQKIIVFFKTLPKKIEKNIQDTMSKIGTYILSKPTTLKDYIKLGGTYISKKFILKVIVVMGLIFLGLTNVIIPYLEGRFWAKTVTVNSNQYYEADGKVKVLDMNDNLIYTGSMANGRITGQGKLYAQGKLVYEGGLKEEKYDGEGKLYEEQQLLYEGGFSNNQYNGEGKLYYANQNINYQGAFQAGKYSNGTEYYEDGTKKYEGAYKEGLYEGQGKLYAQTSQTLVYEGMFSKGQYNGAGKQYKDQKLVYEGNFKDGQYSAEGKLYFDNGKLMYQGGFEAGKYNGVGSLYSQLSGRLIYTGMFKDNLYDGTGILYNEQTARVKYDGAFLEGVYNGLGILYNNNQKAMYTGNFYYGQIDYESFCDSHIEDIRKAFGNEKELIMLENSFLTVYDELKVIFEFSNSYENKKPLVNSIKIFGTEKIHNIANNEMLETIKLALSNNIYTEYDFKLNQQELYSFNYANPKLKKGDTIYSIKYIFDSSYIRVFSNNSRGKILYYEIGGI
jgi:hypothetical protein